MGSLFLINEITMLQGVRCYKMHMTLNTIVSSLQTKLLLNTCSSWIVGIVLDRLSHYSLKNHGSGYHSPTIIPKYCNLQQIKISVYFVILFLTIVSTKFFSMQSQDQKSPMTKKCVLHGWEVNVKSSLQSIFTPGWWSILFSCLKIVSSTQACQGN